MAIFSAIILIFVAMAFGVTAYFAYEKNWWFPFSFCLIICATSVFLVLPETNAFMRTSAWAAFVTALESTGQGLNRLNGAVDDIRTSMQKDSAELNKVQTDTRAMQASLRTSQDILKKQQEKLSDLDGLMKAFYEARKTQIFETATDSANLVVFKHDDKRASIYLLLAAPPIPQTLDLQWHIFAQPKNSVFILSNVVIFRWADSPEKFRSQQLAVSYVAEPKKKAAYSKLSMNGSRVLADKEPLMYAFVEDDPVFPKLIHKGEATTVSVEAIQAAVHAETPQ